MTIIALVVLIGCAAVLSTRSLYWATVFTRLLWGATALWVAGVLWLASLSAGGWSDAAILVALAPPLGVVAMAKFLSWAFSERGMG
jgi:hypothetical protein